MAKMGCYCKAYPISEFRRYSHWTERPVSKPPPSDDAPSDGAEEEPYLFLQEDLTVTDGVLMEEHVVFDSVTPEWEAYCREQLRFEIPDWCREEASPAV